MILVQVERLASCTFLVPGECLASCTFLVPVALFDESLLLENQIFKLLLIDLIVYWGEFASHTGYHTDL